MDNCNAKGGDSYLEGSDRQTDRQTDTHTHTVNFGEHMLD